MCEVCIGLRYCTGGRATCRLYCSGTLVDSNSTSPFLHSYFHSPPPPHMPPFPYPFQAVKIDSPDYAGEDAEAAVADFRRRIQQYTEAYQPIDPQLDQELSWLKVFNVDQKYEANRIAGWWEGQRGVSCVVDSVLSQSGQWLTDMHIRTYISLLECVTVHVVCTRVSVLCVHVCTGHWFMYVRTYIHTYMKWFKFSYSICTCIAVYTV